MANVTLNQLLEMLRGGIGDLVFRRRPDGRVIVSGKPHYRKGKGTSKQKATRQRFQQAAHWARWAAKEYPIYAELAEAAKDQWLSAYNFALKDWYEAPVIHRIERRDGRILVEATDNVMVTQVRVTVFDEAGKPLEFVDGVRGEGNWWEFAPHAAQAEGTKIVAQAWDLANNVTKLTM